MGRKLSKFWKKRLSALPAMGMFASVSPRITMVG
jgi:hypothetical protein